MLFSQQKVDDVDYEYSKDFLESLIIAQIDDYRKSLNLKPFNNDEVLSIAAGDHTWFMIKTGRVTHDQPSTRKETPFKRVMFYDGMHGMVGENCYKLVVGTVVKLPGETKKTKLKSYQNVATAIAQGWIQSKEGKELLGNPKYVNAGISVVFMEKDKSILATHVIGSESFQLPEGVKPMSNDFGIEPYDKSKCADMDKKYGYLPQLMSDNIFLKMEIYIFIFMI